jgi:hypothetical protein
LARRTCAAVRAVHPPPSSYSERVESENTNNAGMPCCENEGGNDEFLLEFLFGGAGVGYL